MSNDLADEQLYVSLLYRRLDELRKLATERLRATLGERSTALRLYARCVTMLHDELGVEPLPETTALYNTLREMR